MLAAGVNQLNRFADELVWITVKVLILTLLKVIFFLHFAGAKGRCSYQILKMDLKNK